MGTSREDLKAMPGEVQDSIGFALYVAQVGEMHTSAKQMSGMPGVFEIVANFRKDAYRAVYAVQFEDALYVLHAFQKKSHKGPQTPKRDRELIAKRVAELTAARRAKKQAK